MVSVLLVAPVTTCSLSDVGVLLKASCGGGIHLAVGRQLTSLVVAGR